MSFKKIRDMEEKGRIIDEFLKNRKILRGRLLGEKLGKQELARAIEKIQRPVTTAVEKAQKQTDEKQDKVIQQLKENQSELADTVASIAGARLPEEVGSSEEDEASGGVEASGDVESSFTKGETRDLKLLGIDPYDKISADEAQRVDRHLHKNLTRKRRDDTKARARELLDVFNKYLDVHGIEKTGTSLRTHVMKMSPYSTFGKLTIDPQALIGGRLVAYNGLKKKVMRRKVDDDFVHLLTKRYNPKREYSTKVRETFDRLIDLAGISRSSSKSGKCAPLKYYKSPDELCSRLELLMAAKNAGNNSAKIINEAVGILDRLLNDQHINTDEYKALHGEFQSPGIA